MKTSVTLAAAAGAVALMNSGTVTLSGEPELLFAYAVSFATVDLSVHARKR